MVPATATECCDVVISLVLGSIPERRWYNGVAGFVPFSSRSVPYSYDLPNKQIATSTAFVGKVSGQSITSSALLYVTYNTLINKLSYHYADSSRKGGLLLRYYIIFSYTLTSPTTALTAEFNNHLQHRAASSPYDLQHQHSIAQVRSIKTGYWLFRSSSTVP